MTKSAAAKSKKLSRHDLKQDKLVDLAYKFEHYYLTHKNLVHGVIGGIVVAIAAFILISRSMESGKLEESFTMGQAKMAYGMGQFDQAKQQFQKVVSDYSGTPSGEAHYFLGRIAFEQGDFATAESEFQTYLDDFKSDDYLDAAAWAGLAATKDAKGQTEEAAKLYEKIANDFAHIPFAAQALLEGSRLYGKLNQVDKQKELLTRIKSKYPESTFLPAAIKELENLK